MNHPFVLSKARLTGLGLSVFLFLSGSGAALLISWSQYNLRRYGGLDRRRPTPPVRTTELSADFGIEAELLHQLHAAKVMVLHLTAEGRLGRVEVREAEARLAAG